MRILFSLLLIGCSFLVQAQKAGLKGGLNLAKEKIEDDGFQ